MLIKKGGITRNISDKRLPAYKEKGYEPVGGKPVKPPKSGEKKG